MGAVVLDSSIVLALLDPGDAHHGAARAAYPSRDTTILTSASVLAEVLVGASRLGAGAVKMAQERVDVLVSEIVPVDRETAIAAAAIRAKHSAVRLPDAFVIATAIVHGADSILTADRRLRSVDKRVRVVG